MDNNFYSALSFTIIITSIPILMILLNKIITIIENWFLRKSKF